jgi:nicotinate-nucleotide adenylyltransferase
MSHTQRKIGLLGGSFNPAHAGHLHISLEAIKRLGLDEVWWLVSPHNPLKKKSELAAYEKRFASAREVAKHPKIKIKNTEQSSGLTYTVDTVRLLQNRHRDAQFVWLMGADNLAIFHRWRHWQQMFKLLPIVILDRAPFSHKAVRKKAAIWARRYRKKAVNLTFVPYSFTPVWTCIFMRRHAASSTRIRETLATWVK